MGHINKVKSYVKARVANEIKRDAKGKRGKPKRGTQDNYYERKSN